MLTKLLNKFMYYQCGTLSGAIFRDSLSGSTLLAKAPLWNTMQWSNAHADIAQYLTG